MAAPLLLSAQTQNAPEDEPPKPEPVKDIHHRSRRFPPKPHQVTTLDSTALQESPGTIWMIPPGYATCRIHPLPQLVQHGRPTPPHKGFLLRGIGSSRPSRTLVLWTAVRPRSFRGWVYGRSSCRARSGNRRDFAGCCHHIFGDRAMSVAIWLFTRPSENFTSRRIRFGNDSTHDISRRLCGLWSRMAISGSKKRGPRLHLRWLVHRAPSIRSAAKRRANVNLFTGVCASSVYIDRHFFLLFKTIMLAEERQKATAIVPPDSTGMALSPCLRSRIHQRSFLCGLGFPPQRFLRHLRQRHQHRNTDRLTPARTVPSDAVGWAPFSGQHHHERGGTSWRCRCRPFGGHQHAPCDAHRQRVGVELICITVSSEQADVSLGPVKLFTDPPQLRRDGQPFPEPQRRLSRR